MLWGVRVVGMSRIRKRFLAALVFLVWMGGLGARSAFASRLTGVIGGGLSVDYLDVLG